MTSQIRLGILTTHPIQYQIPWFQALSACPELDLTVFFAALPDAVEQGVGFGVSFQWDIPLLEEYRWRRVPSAKSSPSLSGFFGNRLKGLRKLLKAERIDMLLLTGWNSYPLLQGLSAARRLQIPSIVRGESNLLPRRSAWVRLLHRQLLKRYDAFLAIGERNREFYLANGVPSDRIFSAPYFVDNDRIRRQFESAHCRRGELRARWRISERSICFLFAGKLQSKKRPSDLISALEIALRQNRDLSLLVVGNGDLMTDLQRRCRERNLPVSFAGFLNQTEITDAYAAADCLVLPSDAGETWGLVVNEAMVCGLPAIVSDRVGCGTDLVEEGVTGGIFPCGDVEALARKLIDFSSDLARLRDVGARARERVLRGYSVEKAVEGTLAAMRYVKT